MQFLKADVLMQFADFKMLVRERLLQSLSKYSSSSGVEVVVVYGSQTGNTEAAAVTVVNGLKLSLKTRGFSNVSIKLASIKDVAFEDLGDRKSRFMVFMLSTMIEGSPSDDARLFYNDLLDAVNDHRYDRDFLNNIAFVVAGFGNEDFDHYCTPAKNVDKWMTRLSAMRQLPVHLVTDTKELDIQLDPWFVSLQTAIERAAVDNLLGNVRRALQNGAKVPFDSGCCGGKGKQQSDCCQGENSSMGCCQQSVVGTSTLGNRSLKDQLDDFEVDVPTHGPDGKPLSNNQKKKIAMKLRQAKRKELESQAGLKIVFPSKPIISSSADDDNGCCGGNDDKEDGCCKEKPAKKSGVVKFEPSGEDGCGTDDSESDYSDDSDEGFYDEETDVFFPANKKKTEEAGGCGDGKEGDLEDLGKNDGATGDDRPEMVTARHRKQLTKEGYKMIGSHSAVKLCRWTKHHLRGRGGCYKHSFYGITSYQCMEATPSLACANKCVFCWRHHKNPVGKSWRWKEDHPADIVEQAVNLHVGMIKTLKGVPGVLPERLEEAKKVKHCALSLVGEPIMYPRINEMLHELHLRGISTYLVTNAQFPEAIRTLIPVTQLYVSIDAATPADLKEIDRPLFSDYWERLVDSLTALREKQQRTTYRLTLVKRYNFHENDEDGEEMRNYGKLIRIGEPDLIEVKAVTFCGTGGGSDLTIQDVPWPDEVVSFCRGLLEFNPDIAEKYEIACEHRHSCSVLICKKTFKSPEGKWRTWIDYEKFTQLALSGEAFTPADYWATTPDWAVIGAEERGFDPLDTRVYRNGKKDKSVRMHAESEQKFAGLVGSMATDNFLKQQGTSVAGDKSIPEQSLADEGEGEGEGEEDGEEPSEHQEWDVVAAQ